MADLSVREIYDRHARGDANSTPDLLMAAKHFEELEWRAMVAGPVFQLAAVEAGRVARTMREFATARTRGAPYDGVSTHPEFAGSDRGMG